MSATLEFDDRIDVIDPIDWTETRTVYKKMQDEFHLITSPFGISIDDETNLHLAHLIATIDAIDRNLDELSEKQDRSQFSNALVECLRGDTRMVESPFTSAEVSRRMRNLRNIIVKRNIQNCFSETVEKIFYHTEAKRSSRNERKMIAEMKEEWRLSGVLTVLILQPFSTPKFESFFYLCCEMMTAVDMIQDASSDYRTGQISVRPWPSLYLRLLCQFFLPMPKLLWRFPKPTNLFRYTFSFLYEVYWPYKRRSVLD